MVLLGGVLGGLGSAVLGMTHAISSAEEGQLTGNEVPIPVAPDQFDGLNRAQNTQRPPT